MFAEIKDQIKILVKGLIIRFNLGGTIKAYVTPNQFPSNGDITSRKELLGVNKYRVGWMMYNNSPNTIYVLLGANSANEDNFTMEIGAYSSWVYQPTTGCYTGTVTYNPNVAGAGSVMVTELVNEIDLRTDL